MRRARLVLAVTSLFVVGLAPPVRAQRAGEPSGVRAVAAGGQRWMGADLDVDRFRNGDPIPRAVTEAEWLRARDQKRPAWCHYQGDPSRGRLYNWWAVHDRRGLAPRGWRVATPADWAALVAEAGGPAQATARLQGAVGSWSTALGLRAGGLRNFEGEFLFSGRYAMYWTAEPRVASDGVLYSFPPSSDGNPSTIQKSSGLAVRCVAEAGAQPPLVAVAPGAVPPVSPTHAPAASPPSTSRSPVATGPGAAARAPSAPDPRLSHPFFGPLLRDPLTRLQGVYKSAPCICAAALMSEHAGLTVACRVGRGVESSNTDSDRIDYFHVTTNAIIGGGRCLAFFFGTRPAGRKLQIYACPDGTTMVNGDLCKSSAVLLRE